MKAMILAAGKGERMRPLTDTTPKPMLAVGGKPLIQYHVENLVAEGFTDIVINVSYLGHQIENFLGDGRQFGADIQYSREKTPLETGGGIVKAIPLLGEKPFLVVNADVWIDYAFAKLSAVLTPHILAYVVLVDNPNQHPQGDFHLKSDGFVEDRSSKPDALNYTFSGLSVISPHLFGGVDSTRDSLAVFLRKAMQQAAVKGEHFQGDWRDIGTPQRLQTLNDDLLALQ